MSDVLIPVDRFRPIVERWVAEHDTPTEAYGVLGAATGMTGDGWRRRLSEDCTGGRVGWFAVAALDPADVDEFLVAASLTHLWQTDLRDLVEFADVPCEDCGQPVELGVMPLSLMRPDPDSPAGFRRRAGGRRWRDWTLCRRCRAEAIRQRAAGGRTKISVNGHKRHLRSKERIEPRKGGRARLLSDKQLRAAHVVYDQAGLSIRAIVERLMDAGVTGSFGGLAYALHDGWERLGLPTRPRGVAMAMARFGTDGTKTKPQMRRCIGKLKLGPGGRCTGWARHGSRTCWNHRDQEPADALAAGPPRHVSDAAA